MEIDMLCEWWTDRKLGMADTYVTSDLIFDLPIKVKQLGQRSNFNKMLNNFLNITDRHLGCIVVI